MWPRLYRLGRLPLGVRMKYHPIPPVPPKALDNDGIAAVDAMRKLGVTQRRIADHMGVHWRTVANVVHRQGAYKETK